MRTLRYPAIQTTLTQNEPALLQRDSHPTILSRQSAVAHSRDEHDLSHQRESIWRANDCTVGPVAGSRDYSRPFRPGKRITDGRGRDRRFWSAFRKRAGSMAGVCVVVEFAMSSAIADSDANLSVRQRRAPM